MTEKENPAFIERFTIRMPDGMRDSIAHRAKVNGRSMNSEIIQIIQDALNEEQLISDIEKFEKYESDLRVSESFEDKMVYIKKLEEQDPFAAALLKETEEHNLRLIRLLGEHMEKTNKK